MSKYRNALPLSNGGEFLTDGGLETTLVFHRNIDLPHFAAFPLIDTDQGREEILHYLHPYVQIALKHGVGFIMDTPTWRANADWAPLLGYELDALRDLNIRAVSFLEQLRGAWEMPTTPIILNGVIGPRGDGYKEGKMTPEEAEAYHDFQVSAFAASCADMVSAITMNTTSEAIGIARSAKKYGMPCVISLTVETDGKLLDGTELGAAVQIIDEATDGSPIYYMINCAHPTHFESALGSGETWVERIGGVRANASTKSHAELDESTAIDVGDRTDLSRRYGAMRASHPSIKVLGGCCGTDHSHIAAICEACPPKSVAFRVSLDG